MHKATFFNTDTMDAPLPTKKEYLESFTFNETLTAEMAEFSYKRTLEHQKSVLKNIHMLLQQDLKSCLSLTENSLSEEFEKFKTELIKRGENHDKSKFLDPEREPYVYINWKHHLKKDFQKKYEYPDNVDISGAIATHYHLNSHHPGHYLKKGSDTKEKTKQLEKMTIIDLMEMVADWMAVNQEYKTNCKEFAENNIGDDKKWPFSKEQKTKIFTLIDLLEKALQATHDLSYQQEESPSIQLGR